MENKSERSHCYSVPSTSSQVKYRTDTKFQSPGQPLGAHNLLNATAVLSMFCFVLEKHSNQCLDGEERKRPTRYQKAFLVLQYNLKQSLSNGHSTQDNALKCKYVNLSAQQTEVLVL